MDDEDSEVQAFMKKVLAESAAFIRQFTVPLFARRAPGDGTPAIAGTGVPLVIADQHFILTAAHVSDFGTKVKIGVHVDSGDPAQPFLSLSEHGAGAIATESADLEHSDDPLDAAAIVLPDALAKRLASRWTFLPLSAIDPRDAGYAKSSYMACGFPNELTGPIGAGKLIVNAIAYAGTAIEPLPVADPSFSRQAHLAMTFTQEDAVSLDKSQVELPNPKGMSGCGIWRIYKAGESAASWSSDQVRLVAIEHLHNRKYQFLRGTRIAHYLRMIWRQNPDLLKSVQIHLGTSWPLP